MFVCVIQYRNWPLRSAILNTHGTNASPDGLCTRTHTNEALSCWFCCNSFRVDRVRGGNVCLEMPGPFLKSFDSCIYMNPTHGPRAWSLDDRSRLRAGGREQWTVLSGTSAIGHGVHFADRAQGLTGTYSGVRCRALLHL